MVKVRPTVIAAAAVFEPVLLNTKLLYVMPLIFCALAPLKVIVFGADAVTFNVPETMLSAPEIPKFALVAKRNSVPFIVTLKRLAVPFSDELPVKVVVPEVAV